MEISAVRDVFNLQAFLIGCLVLVLCLVIHAVFVLFVSVRSKKIIKDFTAEKKHLKAQLFFLIGIIILLASHLLQIYIWGLALYLFEIIKNEHEAMVYAGSTYTTVGFVSDPLPMQWQLLSVIMAVSGLFAFGWSTAIMLILSQALVPSEK